MSDIEELRAAFEDALAEAVMLDGRASALHAKRLAWEMDPCREYDGRVHPVQVDHCDAMRVADIAWSEAQRLGAAYRWQALHTA